MNLEHLKLSIWLEEKDNFQFIFLHDWTVTEVAYQPARLLCIYDSLCRKKLKKTPTNPLPHYSASIKRYPSLMTLFLIQSSPIIRLRFFHTWISLSSFLVHDSLNSDFLEDYKRKQQSFYPPLLSTKESFEFTVCSKFGRRLKFGHVCGRNIIFIISCWNQNRMTVYMAVPSPHPCLLLNYQRVTGKIPGTTLVWAFNPYSSTETSQIHI